jgi:hypothetical protein
MEKMKAFIPIVVSVVLFLIISVVYFSPVLEGKRLNPYDLVNYQGMSKEIHDYEKKTGEEVLWTNSMFGGMPVYQISRPVYKNLIVPIHKVLNLFDKRPVSFLFLLLIGAYIALLLFGINPWVALIGAIAYAFSSYFFQIIEVGHASKTIALGYLPPIIGSIYYSYNKNLLTGSVLLGIFLSIQIYVNHLQITYYTFLIILIFLIFQLIHSIKTGIFRQFILRSFILLIPVILAVASNLTLLWTTYEYSKYSMRGKSELTVNQENKTSGLDKDYATDWSWGIDETLTLLIPNFKGGSSHGVLTEKSKTFALFEQSEGNRYARQVIKQLPLYWGPQSYTAGPVYVGAVILFLFIFGLFTLKGHIKWWLLTVTVLSILLAWGKHFMFFSNFFFDYFPGYNKFRTVSMTLVIAEFAIPFIGCMALNKFIQDQPDNKSILRGLKYTLYILGGITLLFSLFAGIFDFTGPGDQPYMTQGNSVFIDTLREDRKTLLRNDSLRSLIFVLLTAASLYVFYIKKIQLRIFLLLIGLLILADLWMVDKRYLNNDDFVTKKEASTPFQPYQADLIINQDPDLYYRVFDLTADPFRSSRASYFHKSIGGYHGAKMKRYQELIEYHLSQNNMNVINMLNTKYFIISTKSEPEVRVNQNALGNCWFVKSYRLVNNADDEIAALNDFNPESEAIIDIRFQELVTGFNWKEDTSAYIKLTSYDPNELIYEFSSESTDQLVVFSDIFYDKGWNLYLDGVLHPHFRVDYVLRGAVIPKGDHKIDFKFEPRSYYIGNKVTLASSIILVLLALGVIGWEVRKKYKTSK